MPKFKIDNEGYLLKEDGQRFMIDDEPVQATGIMTQDRIDDVVKDRLNRQKKEYATQIATLESQANKTPELEKLLANTKESLSKVEEELVNAKRQAEAEVSAQMGKLKTENEKLAAKVTELANARVVDQVTNMIMSTSSDKETGKPIFINTSRDVVPQLLKTHKREPMRDETGKVIEGQFLDLFEVEITENDKQVKKHVPVDKAIEVFSSDPSNKHYLIGNNAGGPPRGGGITVPNIPIAPSGERYGVGKIAHGLQTGALKSLNK